MLHDSDHVAQHLIEEGDISLLNRLGVHNYDENTVNEAYVAMVFSEADILPPHMAAGYSGRFEQYG